MFSPLRNDNIPIQDMHTHKSFRSALLMQRLVSHIAFRETAQEKFCSGTKRYIVTYRCIAKCHKALQNARVKQRTPGSLPVRMMNNWFFKKGFGFFIKQFAKMLMV